MTRIVDPFWRPRRSMNIYFPFSVSKRIPLRDCLSVDECAWAMCRHANNVVFGSKAGCIHMVSRSKMMDGQRLDGWSAPGIMSTSRVVHRGGTSAVSGLVQSDHIVSGGWSDGSWALSDIGQAGLEVVRQVRNIHDGVIRCLSPAPRSPHTFLSCSEDKRVVLWDVRISPPNLDVLGRTHRHPVQVVAFAPPHASPLYDDLIMSVCRGGSLLLWDLRSTRKAVVECDLHNCFPSLASPDVYASDFDMSFKAGMVALQMSDGSVGFLDLIPLLADGFCRDSRGPHSVQPRCFAVHSQAANNRKWKLGHIRFFADSTLVATSSEDGCLLVFDPLSGRLRSDIQIHGNAIWSFCTDEDHRWDSQDPQAAPTDPFLLYSCSEDSTIAAVNVCSSFGMWDHLTGCTASESNVYVLDEFGEWTCGVVRSADFDRGVMDIQFTEYVAGQDRAVVHPSLVRPRSRCT
ncbi:mitochondrial WD40 domain-containing protein [Andalucia godoyi]|uniref:Mitochondrial WD40 domain-containing protein n=1 Tax=Andalucia godoyi TaxID=505711 RepID=A0A8K0AK33_ANDGO|nr:mitochondrial WD40 domain-containing protein [Andalucia godoyi]|eukprot:ANDGO_02616.mRNA.1 mitochondrial WD40 domain-containing protein